MSALARLWRRAADPARSAVLRSTHRTHVGRVRTVNEDRVLDRPDRSLWAVADGMGGHAAGDRAAQIAIDTLQMLADASGPITDELVLAALAQANVRIAADGGSGGSGTTIVAASVRGARARLFWAGDSRAYLVRDGAATVLTRDHSVVQELIDAGLLTEAAAARHPQANVITRALGIGAEVAIETAALDLRPGDMLLLCSDGLSRSLDGRDFQPGPDLDALADRLLMNALRRDGGDNTSLILIG